MIVWQYQKITSSCIAPQTEFQLTRCFRKNFPGNTHLVRTTCANKMAANKDSDPSHLWVLQQQLELGQVHQSSGGQQFHHLPGSGPTTNYLQPDRVAKWKATKPWWFVIVEHNLLWWWSSRSPTNKKDAWTSSAYTADTDVIKQS